MLSTVSLFDLGKGLNGQFYPPGSKSEALKLGVHLILLYFIRTSLLSAETFFYFDGGVDGSDFLVL